MGPYSEILEISSDEGGGWDERRDDNLGWISELFDPAGCKTEDSDEVLFVGETQSSKPAERPKQASGDDLDDDCTILEGDPVNHVAVVNDSADGSDELLVVGEKGQLACRDYPHPRHLCAKFPFSSTPHDKYCDVCHCYVCDSLAPCIYWGTGVSTTDHCHSTDKEEIWRVQRKFLKQGKLPLTPCEKLLDTTLSETPSLPNQALAFNPLQLSNGGSVTHPVSLLTPASACFSTASFVVPVIGHGSNQQPGLTLSGTRYGQNLSRSPPMLGANNLIRRESNHVDTLGPQYGTQLFKRVGYVPTVSPMNQHGYASSNSINEYASKALRDQLPLVMENDEVNVRWQDFQIGSESDFSSCQSSSQPDTGSSFSEFQQYTNCQPQVYSQPIPQLDQNQNLYQQDNPAPAAANFIASDFNSGWMDCYTLGAQHSPPEGSQIQDVQLASNLQPVQGLYQNENSPVSCPSPQYLGIPNPGSSESLCRA